MAASSCPFLLDGKAHALISVQHSTSQAQIRTVWMTSVGKSLFLPMTRHERLRSSRPRFPRDVSTGKHFVLEKGRFGHSRRLAIDFLLVMKKKTGK